MRDVVLGVITRLKANAAIVAVVGTRVYRTNLPASPTFPAITVTRVDKGRNPKSSTIRTAHARIQCTAWMQDPNNAGDGLVENLSELIADCMIITNTMLTAGTSTVYVVSVSDGGGTPDQNMDLIPPIRMEHRDLNIIYDY